MARLDDRLLDTPQTAHEGTDGILRSQQVRDQKQAMAKTCGASGGKTVDDLARFCCHNQDCHDYGQRGADNLTVCMRYGKHQHLRLLYCRSCKARFSERQGTPLFGAKLETAQRFPMTS